MSRYNMPANLKKYVPWVLLLIPVGVILGSPSSNPWLFGKFSLLHVLVLTGYLIIAGYGMLLYYKFGKRAMYFITAIVLSVVLVLSIVEAFVHIYAWIKPGYLGYGYQPDEFIGWKPVPNIEYLFTGYKAPWYQKEFLTTVKYDSGGFRNQNAAWDKKPQSRRIGLYGDSFIEAREVPFEYTSSTRLEARMNSNPGGTHYEVLNFGISGHSVGQNYLSWKHFGSRYSLDYVFLLVCDFTMNRTSDPVGTDSLQIRPTFSLNKDTLVFKKAEDYDKLVDRYGLQMERIQSKLGNRRSEIVRHGFFLKEFFIRLKSQIGRLQDQYLTPKKKTSTHDVSRETLDLNLEVIKAFGKELKEHNTQFVILDACTFFNPKLAMTSQQIYDFCRQNNFHHIDLSKKMTEAQEKGLTVRWPDDGHFNQEGNRVLAEAVAEWLNEKTIDRQLSSGSCGIRRQGLPND